MRTRDVRVEGYRPLVPPAVLLGLGLMAGMGGVTLVRRRRREALV